MFPLADFCLEEAWVHFSYIHLLYPYVFRNLLTDSLFLTDVIIPWLLLFLRLLKLKMDTSWLVLAMMACLENFVK